MSCKDEATHVGHTGLLYKLSGEDWYIFDPKDLNWYKLY